ERPTPEHKIASALVPDLTVTDYDSLFRSAVHVSQQELDPAGWRFEDRRLTDLFNKIRGTGTPLNEYCGASPYRGIVTGLNEAFVISNETREQLLRQDKRSAEIFKPFLEGKDLKPWRYEWRGLWLIYAHHDVEIKKYPAVMDYLNTFKSRLEKRATSGNHEWYQLQQPQSNYSAAFAKPKIFYPHFSRLPKFSMDTKGFYGNDKTYCIPSEDYYLLAVLQSLPLWYVISRICPAMRGGFWRYELRVQYMETLPIPDPGKTEKKRLERLSQQLGIASCPNRIDLQNEVNDLVGSLFKLSGSEQAVLTNSTRLPPSSFDNDGEDD
ncbi:MAG TPA: TaqI-like C-terminal specificity domain-containing protein, partial [Planctomycetaceae bacterium]